MITLVIDTINALEIDVLDVMMVVYVLHANKDFQKISAINQGLN
jgi:hypothetical protein